MKLEDMFHINNFVKKSNTDHQVRHFSKGVVEKFKNMTRRKNKKDLDYTKIIDDEETIKRIRADINKGFITPDGFNNKKHKKNL
tara:strand:- start:218 stop:469 length:252 start_codon:yes stop_codon:yes gene_type:complete